MKIKEKHIQILLVIAVFVMTILRFLLNEKGRVSPDSIRFLRFAHVFPVIDNTITPTAYPAAIKFLTFFGSDEFWSSKILGLICLLGMILFAKLKQFYLREVLTISCLFSFVSIFAATLSEALMLPFIFILIYLSSNCISGKFSFFKSVFYLSLTLIALYNIRYTALFFMIGFGIFGLFNFRKSFGKTMLLSSFIAGIFLVLYQFLFINYFNSQYLNQSIGSATKGTAELLPELFSGLTTSFNPFIHIANPGGGMINIFIYGIGAFTIIGLIFLCVKFGVSIFEKFLLTIGITGILMTYFAQYIYWLDPLNFRLLSPFTFPLWLVLFRKLFIVFSLKTYVFAFLSLASGFIFTVLSKGNYLENRKSADEFLTSQGLKDKPILFYIKDIENLEESKLAELLSTVNPNLDLTFKPKDTIKKTTLTQYKVLQKIKIDRNKYQ